MSDFVFEFNKYNVFIQNKSDISSANQLTAPPTISDGITISGARRPKL